MKRIPASAALIVLAIGVGACGATSRPAATPPSSSTTTIPVLGPGDATTSPTTPPAIDVATIPAQITVPYINAVFAALNHVRGNVGRADVPIRNIPPSSVATIRALYTDALYASELRIASDELVTGPTTERNPAGDPIITVNEVLKATPSCVFVEATSDFSQVDVTTPPPDVAEYWVLEPKIAGDDPGHLNPTAWMIAASLAEVKSPVSVPKSPC